MSVLPQPAPAAPQAVPALADRILIVVPALNEAAGIERCLRSLLADAVPAPAVVVADGGSTDATRAIVAGLTREFPTLRLIDNPGRLQAAAVNRAVRDCAGPGHDIVVRADAHAAYPPGFARAVAERLLETDAAALAVVMDARGTGRVGRAAALIVDTPLGSGGSAHRGGRRSGWVDHGHHAGFRRSWFEAVGGYDEGFSHNEDAELDHRLRAAGGRIWLEAGIRLDYRMRETLGALARQYWRYGLGRARTIRKHRLRPRLRQAIPAANLALLAVSLAAAPWTSWALVWPVAYGAALLGTSLWGAWRLRATCGLLAGPALAAMHLPWGAGFLWGVVRRARP